MIIVCARYSPKLNLRDFSQVTKLLPLHYSSGKGSSWCLALGMRWVVTSEAAEGQLSIEQVESAARFANITLDEVAQDVHGRVYDQANRQDAVRAALLQVEQHVSAAALRVAIDRPGSIVSIDLNLP